jgi:hypothetical protein
MRMSTTIDPVFKPEELRAARTEVIDEQIRELRVFASRATSPVKRVVLSELEQRFLLLRAELENAGLIDPKSPGVL